MMCALIVETLVSSSLICYSTTSTTATSQGSDGLSGLMDGDGVGEGLDIFFYSFFFMPC
jgi:hypothetical protein